MRLARHVGGALHLAFPRSRFDSVRRSVASMTATKPRQLPFVLGLTGSIGMGKSTVCGFLTDLGIALLDSDKVVHELYSPGGAAVGPIGALFPSVVVDGAVSRPALSPLVLGPGNEAAMAALEAVVHPLVSARRASFIAERRAAGDGLVVLDIPLLYETGHAAECDAVAVVSTGDAALQRARVLARPGMTPEKLDAILSRQVPDEEKRRRADYVIDTSTGLEAARAQVQSLVRKLLQ